MCTCERIVQKEMTEIEKTCETFLRNLMCVLYAHQNNETLKILIQHVPGLPVIFHKFRYAHNKTLSKDTLGRFMLAAGTEKSILLRLQQAADTFSCVAKRCKLKLKS